MTARAETIEEFLARGGNIKTIKASDDRYAHHTSHFKYSENWLSKTTIENAFRTKRTVKNNIGSVGRTMTGKQGFKGKHLRGFGNHKEAAQ